MAIAIRDNNIAICNFVNMPRPSPPGDHQQAMRVLCLIVCLFSLPMYAAVPASLPEVDADLAAGRADAAITHLQASLATDAGNAEAHHLLCRVYYEEGRWDDAIKECEAAVKLAPSESNYHLWLGRAYGEKADAIHSIKAFGLARKTRGEFEHAVQLDGSNADALSDLGDFYVEAPGIVGGGKQKAQGVAQSLQAHNPAQADQIQARLAEKDKNYSLAEQNFKAAVEASHHSPDAYITLAEFYARRQQWDKMLDAVRAGIDADARSTKPYGPALVDAASLLSRTQHEPQLAVQLLKQYLASENKSADAPAFRVHAQLGRLLQQQGDPVGAQKEMEAATALARDYHPAH
jgi:lipopolysaccharide biosynthesis regulator YciM